VLRPAGFENAQGIITTNYLKDQNDPQWKDDAGIKKWIAFMDKYYPDGDKNSSFTTYGYTVAQNLHKVLQAAGNNLTRENVMKVAGTMKDLELDLLLPGIKINTSPTDFYPIEQQQLIRFKGDRYESFGPILSGEVRGS